MSEPKVEPAPASVPEPVNEPVNDAARVYEELNFDRAPVPPPLAPVAAPSVARAVALGGGAAVLGALVYFGVRAITGYELGLIAIGVGIVVGVAVRMGASGSTHRGYRILAIALAYTSVVATYVPEMVQASHAEHVGAALVISASLLAFAVPFLMLGQGEIMSVVILGIALWEAWKFSAPKIATARPAPPAP